MKKLLMPYNGANLQLKNHVVMAASLPFLRKKNKVQRKRHLVNAVLKHVQLKGPCPFHPGQSGSFMVSPEKNLFKCCGCGKEGGPAEFRLWIENKPE